MLSKRQQLELLRSQLELERSSFITLWRDLDTYLNPTRGRWNLTDNNRDRRNFKVIDSTGPLAVRTLSSGMMTGITSPARPWFMLTVPDSRLAEDPEVKEWLTIVTELMTNMFLRSNLYSSLPGLYGDLGTFGTSAILVEEDFNKVLKTKVFSPGSYAIADGANGIVDVFFREFRMTVRQVVEEFMDPLASDGNKWDNFSIYVRNLHERGHSETWIDVCHVVRPNPNVDSAMLRGRSKKYVSCYYEKGSSSGGGDYLRGALNDDVFLRQSGYDWFPVLCPRWNRSGDDVYGTDCPGMIALGDAKALQVMHKRKNQAIEKMVNPPMQGGPELQNKAVSTLPGGLTITGNQGLGLRPAHEVNPRIAELKEDIFQYQERIRKAYFEPIFLMLSSDERNQRATAREVDERHEEKYVILGSVLERLDQELLDPLIDIAFALMMRQDLIPEAPEALRGERLKVRYLSILATAQQSVVLPAIERTLRVALEVAAVDPGVLNKLDLHQIVDEVARATGAPSRMIRSDEEVAQLEAAQQQAAQAQRMVEMIQGGAKSAKDLSGASLEGANALTALTGQAR